jgi:hypothetical protein
MALLIAFRQLGKNNILARYRYGRNIGDAELQQSTAWRTKPLNAFLGTTVAATDTVQVD